MSIRVHDSKEASIYDNLIINPKGDYWGRVDYNQGGNYFGNNTVINPDGRTLKNNPNTYSIEGIDTNKLYDTANEAGYTEDFTFIKYKFTINPVTVILENVLKAD